MEREDIQDLKDELRNAFVLAKDSLPIFRSAITNKNAVIFLGNTRSGKSTLINYVIASRLMSFKIRKNLYKIEKVNEDERGPHIGQGSVSDTTIPGIYEMINYPNAVAIDAPGFADNRGEVQDIMNAVFVNQIRFARTCKFVLVSDINDIISDNIGGFLSLIAKVNELMPDFENLRKSSSLVVTKDNNEYTQDEIAELLQQKILDICGLNICQQNMDLIKCFAQQDELIGLFRMPSEEGEVVRNLDVNIEGAISSTRPLSMEEVSVKFAISTEAQVILLELFQEFSDNLQFKEEFERLINSYRNHFDVHQYIYASTDEELQQTKRVLISLRERLFIAQNRFLQTVDSILSSIMELVHLDINRDFYKTLTLFAMLNEVGLIQQSFVAMLVQKYRQALRDLMVKIKDCIKHIEEEEETRKNLDLNFNAGLMVTGTSVGAAAIGGALLRSLTMRTVATRLVGAVTGIGTVLTVVGAAASLGSYMIKKEETEKRTEARRSQGRPVPIENSESTYRRLH